MDPVAAFLTLNWVKQEPDTAKYSLAFPVDTLELTKSDEDELRTIAKKRGWVLQENQDIEEDTSDLVDPVNGSKSEGN